MDGLHISYCNLNGFIIKNQRYRYDIIDNLCQKLKYNINNIKSKIYSDRLLKGLTNKKILSTYITNGKQVYLYLTKIYNECVSLIIETTNLSEIPKIIAIPLNFSEYLYNNTLFFGEILKTKNNNWMFIIENILLYNNQIIKNNVYKNIELINSIIKNDFKMNDISPFELKIKKFFNIKDTQKELLNLGYQYYYKGIKILGDNLPIIYYFDYNYINNNNNSGNRLILPNIVVYTKKNIDEIYSENIIHKQNNLLLNTIDKEWLLIIKKTSTYGIYHVYSINNNNNNNLIIVGKARIGTIELSNEIIGEQLDNIIVKCIYSEVFKKFNIITVENKKIDSDMYNNISKYVDVKKDVDIKNQIISPDYI